MLPRILNRSLFLAFLGFTACSGGQSNTADVTSSSCGDVAVFCLQSCSLGCVQNGCEIREIAQNQRLRFQFSQDVDPSSVDATTISLKTALGEEPNGSFVTEGATITYVPEVTTVGAATFFGFSPNQEYILTLPGGSEAGVAVRSTAGDRLLSEFSCVLRVTGGIVDLDAAPPRATVIAPAETENIPRDSEFVLQFSEVIDHAPFILNPSGPDAPVRFLLLPPGPSGGCDFSASASQIFGTFRLEDNAVSNFTTLTFTPSQSLPGNRCVNVLVSPSVRDLAGTPAFPQSFLFTIDATSVFTESVVELFQDDTMLDTERSSGLWSGGEGSFFDIGGDGRHGDFDHTKGVLDEDADEWVFNTGDPILGDPENGFQPNDFTQGEYHFTRFVVPAGVNVRFTGAFPARIHVRGQCDIRGKLSFSGVDLDKYTTVNSVGQPGSAGGPGAGAGGTGGSKGLGAGDLPENDGQPGEPVQVDPGHFYAAQAPATAGLGSEIFPADGLSSSIVANIFSFSGMAANGGGGGGYIGVGGEGIVIEPGHQSSTTVLPPAPPANQPGGSSYQMLPLPGVPIREHFMVGGSGGGGGGSHPFYKQSFIAGAGGTGGGGVAQFRVGNSFGITPGGVLEARGGNGHNEQNPGGVGQTLPCPGGAGSGGSMLIQLGTNNANLVGALDASGGAGGNVELIGTLFLGHVRAGDGAPGIYRFEAPAPLSLGSLDAMPAPTPESSATLSDSDALVGVMSRVFDTGLAVAPIFVRYEIDATVNGVPVTFSDDPDFGVPALPGAAIQFLVQGVSIDPETGQPDTFGPDWYRRVGASGVPGELSLNSAATSGLRWQVLVDAAVAGGPVTLQRVEVVFQF